MNKFLTLMCLLSLSACGGISDTVTLPAPTDAVQTATITSSKTPTPAAVNLGSTGSNKFSQTAMLKNGASISLDFTQLQMSIQAPNPSVVTFSVDTSKCLKLLQPQESCELNFTFDPTQAAGQLTEAYTFAEATGSDGINYSAAFQLNAIAVKPGLAPAGPYNNGTLSTTTNSNSATGLRYIALQNNSNGPVKDLRPGSYGQLSLYLNSCSEVLLAGQSCMIFLSESGMTDKTQNVVVTYTANDYNGHSLNGSVTTTPAVNSAP